jgi:hypothetical protein
MVVYSGGFFREAASNNKSCEKCLLNQAMNVEGLVTKNMGRAESKAPHPWRASVPKERAKAGLVSCFATTQNDLAKRTPPPGLVECMRLVYCTMNESSPSPEIQVLFRHL